MSDTGELPPRCESRGKDKSDVWLEKANAEPPARGRADKWHYGRSAISESVYLHPGVKSAGSVNEQTNLQRTGGFCVLSAR